MKQKIKVDRVTMLAGAYLCAQGIDPKGIATLLDVSGSTVYKLLIAARGEFLEKTVRFRSERLSAEEFQQVQQRAARTKLPALLSQAFRPGTLIPAVRVFHSGTVHENLGTAELDAQHMMRRTRLFTRNAAPYVENLLAGVDTCGITWGGTMASLVDSLDALRHIAVREAKPVQVVPLCGERFGDMPTSMSASTVAERLGAFLNGKSNKPLSLGMVPAFIPPEDFEQAELRAIWKLIRRVEAYSTIFGQSKRQKNGHAGAPAKPPLSETLDMIITGISAEARPLGFNLMPLLADDKWSKLLLGDIAGVCFAQPNLNAARRKKVERLNEGWTGLRIEHLRNCANRAAAMRGGKTAPGVVVLAIGRQKAACVAEAIRQGLVNHLYIDEDLEFALKNMLEKMRTGEKHEGAQLHAQKSTRRGNGKHRAGASRPAAG